MPSLPAVSALEARRLLLGAQGLLDDPACPATPARLQALVERMGFVQVDSINVVERAHHLTLGSRLDAYRPPHLTTLLENRRSLFEHWTHDASAIPTAFFPHWRHRFERYRRRFHEDGWLRDRLGPRFRKVMDGIRERIRGDGPVLSRDFEHDRKGEPGGWWGWKPQKAALEVLWRAGELAIARREGFQKVYDLMERVLPEAHARPAPPKREHEDWACREALDRLGVATPGEIAAFWHAVGPAEARRWCREALRRGEIEEVLVESVDGAAPRRAVAVADWRARLKRLPTPPDRMRLLSPFDPILRDRKRALRLFGFDYRIEVFVPAPRRRYGYYVMPVLDGEELVARVEPKFRRDTGTLEVRGVWWEGRPRAARRLRDALQRLAALVGARRVFPAHATMAPCTP
ncbi:MAG: YcaQ family DNA glycosylase [Planctomycetia bacterium]|nr:YcaQ family DNA glycosylase [Planctomycetia bacterium]